MVLAALCCSEDTRAYRATRREAERTMVVNLQPVFERRERKGRESWPNGYRPGLAESRGAPTRRRAPDTAVPDASVRRRERQCVWASNGDGQTWPTSFWQLRKVK